MISVRNKQARLFSNGARDITQGLTFFDCLFMYVPEIMSSLSFKGNIIWTCSVGTVTSLSVAFISFAKKGGIDIC